MGEAFIVVDSVDCRVVVVSGDIDGANAAEFSLACACTGPVVVDLRACSYIDSSGLNVLIARARSVTVALVLTAGCRIYRIFEITALLDHFRTAATVEQAVSLVTHRSPFGRPQL